MAGRALDPDWVERALRVEAEIWIRERSRHGESDARAVAREALRSATSGEVDDDAVDAYLRETSASAYRDNRLWDARARKLRWVNTAQQLFCAFVIAAALFVAHNVQVLRMVVVLSTLAEMCQWMGHTWLWRPGRRLPLWCVSDAFGAVLERHPLANALCTISALVLLLGAMMAPQLLLVAAIALTLVACIDMWRALYIHYWLLALFALHFPNTPLSLCIMLGCLYGFSGAAKFVSAAFHQQTAPWVFEPIFRVLRVDDPEQRYWLSRAGVAGEVALGLGMLAAFALPAAMRAALAVGIVALHAYIIVGIGLRTGIRTFVSWNAFCACAAVCVLQRPVSLWPLHPFHLLLTLVMAVPPLWPRMAAQYPTLAHAYFVPTPESTYLLVPAEHAHRIPLCENGHAIKVWGPGSAIDRRACKGDPAVVVLCSSSGWVDWALSYGGDYDECNETFGASSTGFWNMIARRVVHAQCKVVTISDPE